MLVNNTIESSKRPGIPGPHRPDLKWFKDALDGKSDVGHVHKKKDIEDFEHNHDGRYYRKDEHELQLLLSGNGTPNFNQGINGDYYVDELNGDLYKKSGDAWNLIIHLEGEQGIPGPQGNPGIRGPEGPTGKEGYTPVRGTDYWTPEDEEIIRQSIVSEVALGLSSKVDKVEGKGLSTEDFTTLLKQKLEELQNYDDRDIRELLEKALYNVTIDVKTGILTFHTIDESTFTVDLPLELIVSDGYLNKDTNTIVLVLANGNTINIPVENLIKDFYSKSEVDQKIEDLAEEVAINFEDVDEELAKAQAQIDALKAENEAQQKELDVLYNDLVPGEANGETAVVTNGVTGSKVEIDGDGNTVQEVIEAVEGTTVVDTNMNLTDVDTTFENSLLPMGNISQETREAYQLLSTDEANLTVVQGSDAAHLQYYDDGFINAFNNVTDAETELIYTVPTKHITSGKKYTLGIEYKYTNRASIYLRNVANDESVKALNTNLASSIKLTNTANSDYMSVSVILKANSSATFRLTLAEGTEQKPWQVYDPDNVMPSLKYPSPVKGIGRQENVNKLPTAPEYTYTANGGEIYSNGKGEYRINGTFTATTYFNFILNEEYKIQKGDYLHCVNDKSNGNVAIALIYNNEQIMFTSLDSKNKIQDLSPYIGRPFNRLRLYTNANNTMDITVTPMITKNSKNSIYTPNNKCRYNTKIENENIYSASMGIESGYLDSTDGTIIKGSGWKVTDYIKIPDNVETVTIIDGWGKGEVHCFYDENKKFVMARGMSGSMVNAKIPLTDKCKYARFTVNYTYKETCMIAFGDTDTFVEHAEKNLPIDIPVGQEWYSGKPYKLNGKWYRDNKHLEYTLNETTVPTYFVEQGDYTLFQYPIYRVLSQIYCDKFKYISNWGTDKNVESVYKGGSTYQHIQIKILTSRLREASIEAIKEWLGENNLKVVCELETPIREEITDPVLISQLEALQNAEFYDGVTNINSYASSEDVAEMPLEAHYNFITPAPSPDRDSDIEVIEGVNILNPANVNSSSTLPNTLIEKTRYRLTSSTIGNALIFKDLGLKKGTYTVSIQIVSGNYQGGNLVIRNSANTTIGEIAVKGTTTKLSLTVKDNDINSLVLWQVPAGTDIVYDIQIEKGEKSSAFLPYGHIGLVQRGKNYFDGEIELGTLASGNMVSSTTSYRSKNYIKVKPNTDYSFSINSERKQVAISFYSKDKTWINSANSAQGLLVYNTKFTTPKDCYYVKFRSFSADFDLFANGEIQIEDGDTVTNYEPYIEPIVHSIDLAGEKLAKVGDIKDILNIGVDGSVSANKDFSNFKRLTSDMTWSLSVSKRWYYTPLFGLSIKHESDIISTHFKKGIWDKDTSGDEICLGNNVTPVVGISATSFDSIDTLKKFLDGNEVYIIGQLKETEVIKLPSIAPIELFEGTNIFELITSLPTTLTAHYKVSSKKQLIENNERITALEATVNTLLGGN